MIDLLFATKSERKGRSGEGGKREFPVVALRLVGISQRVVKTGQEGKEFKIS